MDTGRTDPNPPYPPAQPPAVLYHAISADRLTEVLRDGLVPAGRPHVHLSRRPEHARNAIREELEPVVLLVDTAAMHAAGFTFYASPKGTWLTGPVPARFLENPGDPPAGRS